MRLSRSSRFKRSFKKLPKAIQDDLEKRLNRFVDDPFDPLLRTHKLRGNLASYFALCLRDGYRVLFVFQDRNAVLLVNVGSHDDYDKWSRG